MRFLALLLLTLSFNASALVVLQYHHISSSTPSSTSISVARFEEHLKLIEQEGFTVISIPQFIDYLDGSLELPENSVLITFDDGYEDVLTNAVPLLVKRGWPFSIFVVPSLVDSHRPNYMSWEQLNSVRSQGGSILNHTMTHAHLPKHEEGESETAWRSRMKYEVLDAENMIFKNTGENYKILAYPYGEYNPELISLLKTWGFRAFTQASGAVDRSSNDRSLPRFPFGGPYGKISDFKLKLLSYAIPDARASLFYADHYLESHLLSHSVSRPNMTLTWKSGIKLNPKQMTCFGSDIGRVNVTVVSDHEIKVSSDKDFNIGRARYNCTAPSMTNGRYYWFSQPFIRLAVNDQWPPEP